VNSGRYLAGVGKRVAVVGKYLAGLGRSVAGFGWVLAVWDVVDLERLAGFFLNEKLPHATEQKIAKDAKEPATLLASMHWFSN
jgi:hypothetical protein